MINILRIYKLSMQLRKIYAVCVLHIQGTTRWTRCESILQQLVLLLITNMSWMMCGDSVTERVSNDHLLKTYFNEKIELHGIHSGRSSLFSK
jgi:hypothetical protein